LYRALKSSKINSVSGTLIYDIVVALNLDVKPDIKIMFVKRGTEVSLKEYVE